MDQTSRLHVIKTLIVAAHQLTGGIEEWPEAGIAEVDVSDMGTSTRCVMAWSRKDLILGIATWDDRRDELEIVKVDRDFRRRGIAQALVNAAEKRNGRPLVDTGERSSEGSALLKKMGRKPAKLKRRIGGREAESLGAMLMSMLYGAIARGKEIHIKSDWMPLRY